MLLLIGATEEGKKELIAVHPGVRESDMSWKEVLVNIRDRGLQMALWGFGRPFQKCSGQLMSLNQPLLPLGLVAKGPKDVAR